MISTISTIFVLLALLAIAQAHNAGGCQFAGICENTEGGCCKLLENFHIRRRFFELSTTAKFMFFNRQRYQYTIINILIHFILLKSLFKLY
jgi:hypothetical protein